MKLLIWVYLGMALLGGGCQRVSKVTNDTETNTETNTQNDVTNAAGNAVDDAAGDADGDAVDGGAVDGDAVDGDTVNDAADDAASDADSETVSMTQDPAETSDQSNSDAVLNYDGEESQGAAASFIITVPALDDEGITDCTVVKEEEWESDESDSDCILTHYSDNGTTATVSGRSALVVHADAYNRYNATGPSVEIEMPLDRPAADMSNEDFSVSFDIYIPEEHAGNNMAEMQCSVQFGLWSGEKSDLNVIYSKLYIIDADMGYDSWNSIYGRVKVSGGDIYYSSFERDPEDWVMDDIRIQVICEGNGAYDDMELLYYVTNIVVKKES